jgi:hypothetical protein
LVYCIGLVPPLTVSTLKVPSLQFGQLAWVAILVAVRGVQGLATAVAVEEQPFTVIVSVYTPLLDAVMEAAVLLVFQR